MTSRTKVAVDRAALERVVREVWGVDDAVTSVRELADGMFNAAYAVSFAAHAPVVVKVAPSRGVPVLTYERDLMRTEIDFYRRAQGVVPVPGVLGADLGHGLLDRDVVVMTHLRGVPLESIRRDLPPEDHAQVQRELGAVVARLGRITGDRFGYDRPAGNLAADTWSGALALMVDAILADAERFGVALPPAAHRVSGLVRAGAPLLDEVRTPVLTHFDLWEGNVFVVAGDDGHGVEAIVDGERAFWGDPLAELVSTALFRDPREATHFRAGFSQAAGSELDLGPDALLRISLYRAYLCLIMAVEGAPRGYAGAEADRTRDYVLDVLAREVGVIGAELV